MYLLAFFVPLGGISTRVFLLLCFSQLLLGYCVLLLLGGVYHFLVVFHYCLVVFSLLGVFLLLGVEVHLIVLVPLLLIVHLVPLLVLLVVLLMLLVLLVLLVLVPLPAEKDITNTKAHTANNCVCHHVEDGCIVDRVHGFDIIHHDHSSRRDGSSFRVWYRKSQKL